MKKKKKDKKISPKTKKIIYISSLIVYICFVIMSLLLTINIFKLNMIPFKFAFLIFIICIICLTIFGVLCINKKIKWKIKIVSIVILIILSTCLFFANHYIDKTISFLKTVTNNNYEVENYYVLVLKDSKLSSESDLLDKKIGYVNNLGTTNEALEELKSEVVFENVTSKNIFELGNSLIKKEVDAILLADYHKSILDEQIENFDSNVKILYKFSIKKESKVEADEIDVTKKSFNIFLSGIDTYGEIDSIARSDVNMVVTINPITKQVLLTSIPRDYYVNLSCYNEKDKLTHAGMYGIDCSIGTIENLLDIDINYYVRVNFSSLIKLVDVLDGIDVYSEYTFNTYGYQFYKGYNNVNGEYALAFARARYNFIDGDRQRVKNQQAVITAIVNKAMSPNIINKYTSILDALKDSFQTNMGMTEIQKLAKFQIDKMPKWNIASVSLNGSDSENYTYSYGTQKLYVMEPDYTTVDYAHGVIEKVMNGEQIDLNSTTTSPNQGANNSVKVTTKTTTQTSQVTSSTTTSTTSNTKTSTSTTTTTATTTKPTTTTTTTTKKNDDNSTNTNNETSGVNNSDTNENQDDLNNE